MRSWCDSFGDIRRKKDRRDLLRHAPGNVARCREEEFGAHARIAGSGEQVIDAVHDAQGTRAPAAA